LNDLALSFARSPSGLFPLAHLLNRNDRNLCQSATKMHPIALAFNFGLNASRTERPTKSGEAQHFSFTGFDSV
jgi:hypothetical protein